MKASSDYPKTKNVQTQRLIRLALELQIELIDYEKVNCYYIHDSEIQAVLLNLDLLLERMVKLERTE